MSFPKVVALDTDWTIWQGFLNPALLGKGPGATPKLEDNIARVDRSVLQDGTNHANFVRVCDDVSKIINDILKNGAKLAIVSRNPSKAVCDRALYYYNTINPKDEKEWSIIDMVAYDEVVDGKSSYFFEVMFDDEAFNNVVKVELGTAFQLVRDKLGMTWDVYQQGIDAWRRAKNITIPPHMGGVPNRRLIGYTGLNRPWIDLVQRKEGIVDTTAYYRWGYGLYVADNLGIAKMYNSMERDLGFEAHVCAVYVNDYDIWTRMNKIWVPENTGNPAQMMNRTWSAEETGKNQEDRDAFIAAQWGVRTPYALFSRHFWFNKLPLPQGQRWNEMLLSTQIVRALIDITLLSDAEVDQILSAGISPIFQNSIKEWHTTVPNETRQEFLTRGETDLYQLSA
ncbi:hypothetical protein CPB83DRAFT_886108 [Crepidotus variabilis]|uniref:Uncharacterized protein n=1 Tax=Crepidotus variabilis TaxID=179855 RepID=A0A9P6E8T3_9AGAR|nr:hypothetical protein CPB83DRAFT_886108 [Crepidotus variabilis]